jgi:hypothetical protein
MVVNPIRSGDLTIGELRCDHFANDYSSGIDQILNGWCCVLGRRIQPIPSTVAIAGTKAFDIIYILDSDTHASQWFVGSLCVVETRWNGDS